MRKTIRFLIITLKLLKSEMWKKNKPKTLKLLKIKIYQTVRFFNSHQIYYIHSGSNIKQFHRRVIK